MGRGQQAGVDVGTLRRKYGFEQHSVNRMCIMSMTVNVMVMLILECLMMSSERCPALPGALDRTERSVHFE